MPCGLLWILPVIGVLLRQAAPLPPVRAVVLGIAQDGGVPHIGCTAARLRARATRPLAAASGWPAWASSTTAAGARFLIDATPDLPSQLDSLNRGRTVADPRRPVDGILLTHAHIGHYTGLMYLGREALGARAVPVYATARMASLAADERALEPASWPWARSSVREVEPGREVVLTPSLAVTPVRVPHRDELSDTVGYVVRGPGQSLLYVPDIDKWEKWDRRVEDEVARVGIALLDGTFFSADELPGRSITEVPHPTVGETMARLAALSSRVTFIHLNHTNPLLWDGQRPPRPGPARIHPGRGWPRALAGELMSERPRRAAAAAATVRRPPAGAGRPAAPEGLARLEARLIGALDDDGLSLKERLERLVAVAARAPARERAGRARAAAGRAAERPPGRERARRVLPRRGRRSSGDDARRRALHARLRALDPDAVAILTGQSALGAFDLRRARLPRHRDHGAGRRHGHRRLPRGRGLGRRRALPLPPVLHARLPRGAGAAARASPRTWPGASAS